MGLWCNSYLLMYVTLLQLLAVLCLICLHCTLGL